MRTPLSVLCRRETSLMDGGAQGNAWLRGGGGGNFHCRGQVKDPGPPAYFRCRCYLVSCRSKPGKDSREIAAHWPPDCKSSTWSGFASRSRESPWVTTTIVVCPRRRRSVSITRPSLPESSWPVGSSSTSNAGLRNSGLECESDTDYNPLRAEFPAIFGPTNRMVSRFGRCPPHSYRIWILDEICVPK